MQLLLPCGGRVEQQGDGPLKMEISEVSQEDVPAVSPSPSFILLLLFTPRRPM